MLVELHIENLGVIERADVVLGPGLTVITGETGAGKTMIVEALDLVVGGRADPLVVRTGAAEARVDARFVTAGTVGRRGGDSRRDGRGAGGDDRDDGRAAGEECELVVTRVVPVEGRSRAYVDGRPTTAAALAELAAGLVDLHGQHAHQRLLATAHQRQALDAFGGIDLTPLHAARARVVAIDAELAALGGDTRSRAHELDLLRYQLTELAAAAITDPGEDETLATIEATLADAVEHQRAGGAAYDTLSADGGVRDQLSGALAEIQGRAPYVESAGRLGALLAELDDVIAELHATAEQIEPDPERLAATVERRQLLRDLRRKYGDDLAAVIAFEADAARRLAELESFDERAAVLDAERAEALADVERAAAAVFAARSKAAPRLARAVTARLAALAMPDARVEISVERAGAGDRGDRPGEQGDRSAAGARFDRSVRSDRSASGDGADSAARADGRSDPADPGDRVQFLIAPNPGTPPLPLARIASGGELARTMLAVRLALGERAGGVRPSTAVFDEVDAGIGGSAAVAVGSALAEIGRATQAIVVTHLAQVAAAATTQLRVSKHVTGRGANAVTATTVVQVDGEERVAEIARMLSGATGEAAAEHARELLLRAGASR